MRAMPHLIDAFTKALALVVPAGRTVPTAYFLKPTAEHGHLGLVGNRLSALGAVIAGWVIFETDRHA
jgi:hypothetical protein